MAFGRLQRSPASRPISDINMTPLIDVMLVLLVIFITTAPLLGSSLRLDLPKSDAAAPNSAPAVLALAIDAEGQLFLGELPLAPDRARQLLTERARDASRRDPGTEVQLRADSRVPYGRVAEVIGWVQEGGLSRIGLVTEAPAR